MSYFLFVSLFFRLGEELARLMGTDLKAGVFHLNRIVVFYAIEPEPCFTAKPFSKASIDQVIQDGTVIRNLRSLTGLLK